ncbi:MAG: FAD-dependent oxidoreductase [Ilumatobacteraceae bacterium]
MAPLPPSAGSLWSATFPAAERVTGAPLTGDLDVDVAIVGAGYTGLWTAHALAEADPALRIAILERDSIGFGASGRNGGWCSALLATGLAPLAARHGRPAAIAMQRAMHDTVDHVVRTTRDMDVDVVKGGTITLARTAAQHARLAAEVDEARAFGFGDDDVRWLTAAETTDRCRAHDVRAATFTPHCAAVHPVRLVHAIARAATALGVSIHEGTAVEVVEPHRLTTAAGAVRAEVVVLATEAYATRLPGRRRDVVPLYSSMVGTEPLSDGQWAAIGLADRPTFNDARHSIVYGQRTTDGRLAFGGRGAPYHFGSRIEPAFDTDERVRAMLVDAVRELFPVLDDVAFPFHWGGPLGVPRDWRWSVHFDRTTGLASAGGYVGDGVSTANLAGRTLADLITGRDSDLTRLGWVGQPVRRWEPEPMRWLGINLARRAAVGADSAEGRDGRTSRLRARAWRRLLDALTGR